MVSFVFFVHFVFNSFEIYLISGTVILAALVSIIPAFRAYRTDVSKNLNTGS